MLDTLRFKIPVTKEIFKLIKLKSVQYKKKDISTGFVSYVFYRVERSLGSFDRNINFFIKDERAKYVLVELSLPKYLFGTNVVLLSFDEIQKALALLYSDFVQFFGDFTPLNRWEVVRADFCYAWKLDTLDDTIKVLEVLRRYKNGRQKKTDYQTSIHSVGQWYSLKFYIKGYEFKLHDYNHLCDSGFYELSNFLRDYSKTVLRFEVTLRRNALLYYKEKKHIYIRDLTKRFMYSILRKYFKRFTKGMNNQFLNVTQIMLKLHEAYGKVKASHLLSFFLLQHASDNLTFSNYCASRSPRTLRRMYYDLSKAGVGFPLSSLSKDYSLSIPSSREVISGAFLPARAGKKDLPQVVTPVEAVIFGQFSHTN